MGGEGRGLASTAVDVSIGYRKRVGFLNVSRRGVGVSVGPRHAKISVGRRGVNLTLSLLGAFVRKGVRR